MLCFEKLPKWTVNEIKKIHNRTRKSLFTTPSIFSGACLTTEKLCLCWNRQADATETQNGINNPHTIWLNAPICCIKLRVYWCYKCLDKHNTLFVLNWKIVHTKHNATHNRNKSRTIISSNDFFWHLSFSFHYFTAGISQASVCIDNLIETHKQQIAVFIIYFVLKSVENVFAFDMISFSERDELLSHDFN